MFSMIITVFEIFCGHVIENDKIYNAAISTLKNDK